MSKNKIIERKIVFKDKDELSPIIEVHKIENIFSLSENKVVQNDTQCYLFSLGKEGPYLYVENWGFYVTIKIMKDKPRFKEIGIERKEKNK